mmetsp:Transcript_86476/g.242048  ORF Transcript_86476/g.242048 Transcript_86476/m.242048 type:complete len:216 (+) Transcript_86476:361-1008(+)
MRSLVLCAGSRSSCRRSIVHTCEFPPVNSWASSPCLTEGPRDKSRIPPVGVFLARRSCDPRGRHRCGCARSQARTQTARQRRGSKSCWTERRPAARCSQAAAASEECQRTSGTELGRAGSAGSRFPRPASSGSGNIPHGSGRPRRCSSSSKGLGQQAADPLRSLAALQAPPEAGGRGPTLHPGLAPPQVTCYRARAPPRGTFRKALPLGLRGALA